MDSLEKLNGLLAGTREIVPEGEDQAKLVQAIQLVGPFAGDFVPDTAEELDALLLGLTRWTIDLRSDDADPVPASEVLAESFGVIKERAAAAGEPLEEAAP